MDDTIDMTPQERAAVVAWRLAQGAELTIFDVESETGLTYSRALRLLKEISRVVAIHCVDGYWQRVKPP
jgi:hypothetical protein